MAEAEHVICLTSGVGIVLEDAQIGLVGLMVQAIEHVGASLIVAGMTRV